ncbi:MAG: sigma 54-interacting transcriptional regulator, partial [Candidatus Zixiibacteriota bacterium]
ERVIEPVGSEKRLEVDVRVVVATNVNLRERVTAGQFRGDLFYRLNVIPLSVPPLRDRREDIPLLVKTFLDRFVPDRPVSVPGNLMKVLKMHLWPGNVRELENLMERMAILRRSDKLTLDDLPADFGMAESDEWKTAKTESDEHVTFYEAEKRLIIGALEKFGWNRTKAAIYLGIPRHILIYRMKKFGICQSETV